MINNRFKIGNIRISAINIADTLQEIGDAILNNRPNYICVTNSRTAYLANHDPKYCQIQNNSLLTVPDGMPLIWIAHNLGFKDVGRVSGPDLMDEIFKVSCENGYSHYFYGSTPETIKNLQVNLKNRFKELKIVRAVSPPFQSVENFDIYTLANDLNELKPTFFWCGLGAPKQEIVNALLQPRLESTICVGVGLAFEYIAGTVKRAPIWMQKIGLEWLYRIIQQPGTIKRVFSPFLWIIGMLLKSYVYKAK